MNNYLKAILYLKEWLLVFPPDYFMKFLTLDLRALALMRICIALVLMVDLSIRLTDLEAFYTNMGVAPLSMLFENIWNPYYISIHTISGLWQVQFVLFVFAFFCAFMLLLGYRTSMFTILSWLMLLSLHNRNCLILQGGDDMLRMVLFWAIFLPWGKRYSSDQLLNNSETDTEPLLHTAGIAYILQLCYLYSGSALLKGPEWSETYMALYYTYSLDQIVYPITKHIFYYPDILKVLTQIAYYFELLVPVLFFIPVKHGFLRAIAVLMIIFFHLLNCLTLQVGLFPFIGIATVMGILPTGFMDIFDKITLRIKPFIIALYMRTSSSVSYIIAWKEPKYILTLFQYRLEMGILIFLTFFTFDWNFSNLETVNSKLSDNLRFIGFGLRLDQNWGMFAPGVFKDDGWYVLEGKTKKGVSINIMSPDAPLHFRKPENIVYMFKNDRWRKYFENYLSDNNLFARGYFCNYMKRVWNEDHADQQITQLKVIYMGDYTLPDYILAQPEKRVLWECIDE